MKKNDEHEHIAVRLYRKRMQIEESFRDLKSSRYGFSFEHSNCRKAERIEIFLLIAMLACLIAYLTGVAAEAKNLHHHFQVNTIKRRVLSYFFLGCRIIEKKVKITRKAIMAALEWVQSHAEETKYVSIL